MDGQDSSQHFTCSMIFVCVLYSSGRSNSACHRGMYNNGNGLLPTFSFMTKQTKTRITNAMFIIGKVKFFGMFWGHQRQIWMFALPVLLAYDF